MSFVDKYAKKKPTSGGGNPPNNNSGGNPPANNGSEVNSTGTSSSESNPSSIPPADDNSSKTMAERYASKKSAPPQSKASVTAQTQADLIYLVKGVDEGKNAWYYVLVDRLKLSLFLKALNDPIIHLEEYGKILYSAYGDEPPEEITNKLKAEYGIK